MSHAARALAVAEALRRRGLDSAVTFASWADGKACLQMHGVQCLDLEMPPFSRADEKIVKAGRAIQEAKPGFVFCDEVLAALLAAKIFDIPAVYMTNWIPEQESERDAEFILAADEILVADLEDGFIVPYWLRDVPVRFVGPVLRLPDMKPGGKAKMKQAEQVPADSPYVLITAGGGADPDIAFHRTAAAGTKALEPSAHTLAIMGAIYRVHRDLCEAFQRLLPYLRMVEFLPDLYERLPAFDLAICRAGHSTLWELALSGVPAVCIPHSRAEDLMQMRYARAMERRGTAFVVPASVDGGTLGAELARLWEDSKRRERMTAAGLALREKADGAEKVAEVIAGRLEA